MNLQHDIEGMKVEIIENDFVPTNQLAYVEKVDLAGNSLLLRLKEPLKAGNRVYHYAVAGTRLEGQHLSDLITGKGVGCAVIWIPAERFQPANPLDVSWWRGGAAAIATIQKYSD
jgi:hypothetical protein